MPPSALLGPAKAGPGGVLREVHLISWRATSVDVVVERVRANHGWQGTDVREPWKASRASECQEFIAHRVLAKLAAECLSRLRLLFAIASCSIHCSATSSGMLEAVAQHLIKAAECACRSRPRSSVSSSVPFALRISSSAQ